MANARDITFATANLHNLQDWDGHTYDTDKTRFADQDEYKRRIDWLAEKLHWLDADVIGFQEIWSVRALKDVFKAAGLTADYELIARDAPGIGKPQVGLAVRKGWKQGEEEWIPDFPETFKFEGFREQHGAQEPISVSIKSFSRPVLRATIAPPASRRKPPPVNVYVAHLKSKGPARLVSTDKDSAYKNHSTITGLAVAHIRRMMEAGALRARLDAEMKEEDSDDLSPTVVMGDLNDDTHAVSTALLSAQPTYKLTASDRKGQKSDKGLYSCETLQQYRSQRHVYYTYNYRNALSSLDHIMVSEEFYDHSRKRHWSFVEMEILNDHLNFADEGRKEKKRLISETGAVDHGLVRAEFVWDPIEDDIKRMAKKYADSKSS